MKKTIVLALAAQLFVSFGQATEHGDGFLYPIQQENIDHHIRDSSEFLLPSFLPSASQVFESYQTYTDQRSQIEPETASVLIPNGSILNFASHDFAGEFIRFASDIANDVQNPLGLSHTGIAIVEYPNIIRAMLSRKLTNNPPCTYKFQESAIQAMLDSLSDDDGQTQQVFCLEASGTASQVLHGIFPHVRLVQLNKLVKEYDGNIYVRQLYNSASATNTRAFIESHLGRPYEGPMTFAELFWATAGLNDTENTERVFCSELVALFCKNYLGIQIANASNIIPESFGYGAGEDDLLNTYASREIPLKLKYDFEHTLSGTCCPNLICSCMLL
jgi:hypothetical protein